MKKLIAILFAALALAANAATLTITPGLSEPLGGEGAIVEAAAFVSATNGATAHLYAVYDVPTYGAAEHVTTNVVESLAWVTNSVVVTNFSTTVTSNYVVNTAFGLTSTNYFTVATNTVESLVPQVSSLVVTTNTVQEVIGFTTVTNDASIASFETGGGDGEVYPQSTLGIYPLAPGARLLFTCDSDPGATVTIFLR